MRPQLITGYLVSEEDDSTNRRIVCTFSEEKGYGVSF